jgi:GMP synthase (glutamine-hydrolysing)
VICGLSGGVDSSVAAVLIHEAIGDQLTCVFVDHGLMRMNEASRSSTLFRDHYNIPLVHATRSPSCSSGLAGVTDPRGQAQVHRRPSSTCSRRRRKKIGGADFLAQGTLYPDVIESVSSPAALGDDQEPPQRRRPARAHEHEAGRAAARAVQGRGARARPRARPARGLRRPPPVPRPGPRHPHPRRGHAREGCDILRKADAIYLEEIRKAGLYDAIWQAFAVLLPVKTVGVMGDGRTYDTSARCAP